MSTSTTGSRQRWLVPVVVVVLSVTVGGGFLARELYRQPDEPADELAVSTSAPSSATGSQPTTAGAISMTDDAKAHPQAEAVRDLIQRYFGAINSKKYSQWVSVVSSERLAQQSQGDWQKGVRTTEDSDALIYRIERGAGSSLRVLVGFTSRQELEDAPTYFQEKCIKWRLVLPVVTERTALKIDAIDPGPPPEHEKC